MLTPIFVATFVLLWYNTIEVIEMKRLLEFLDTLEEKNIYYKLNKVRDAIMVEIAIPGERWEVEFFSDGQIEVEKFISKGEIYDETEFENLFSDID